MDANIISIGQLCDAGCTATFNKETMKIHHGRQIILHGNRSATTHNLWLLHLPSLHACNNTTASATPAELVAFAHAAMGSPSPSTLIATLEKGFVHNFPGLTAAKLKKWTPTTVATAKGHVA